MSEIKILSFNARGLGNQEKRRDVLDYLRRLRNDIYLLQDTHLAEEKTCYFNTLWHGACYHSYGTHNSRGTSILFNSKTQHKILHEEHCPDGNFTILVCEILSNIYTLVNLYGPNEDRPAFFCHIGQKLDELPAENVVIGGDFNFVIDYRRDSNYSRQNNPRARNAFVQVAQEQGLVDIWKMANPDQNTFTWAKRNPYKSGRLDMFFISEHLFSVTLSSAVSPGYRSDHSIVTLHLSSPQKKRGPGLWKFNESLLNDENYDVMVKELIVSTIKQYAIPLYSEEFISDYTNFDLIQFTISHSLFYETLLMIIRGETVKFSKQKAKKAREKEKEINDKICRIKKFMEENPSPDTFQNLEEAQRDLQELRQPKIQGLITRSRVSWYEDGEKCSKYFLSLEKRNTLRNSIQSIRVEEKIVTDKTEILEQFSESIRSKYRKNPVTASPNTYLQNNVVQKLSVEQKNALDEPLSLSELHVALKKMKKGKTPGSNGFSADFFKHFWDFLGPFLFSAWLEKFNEHKNLNSHNESIITLIPKAGVPSDLQKGWRPISLLNVDFKIVSAAVANRLKNVIHQLISPSQTAYIQGRFIGENTRLVYDVIEYLNKTSKSGIIMAIDFEAAFDTVSWEFLLDALDKYNFGPYFKKLINVLYLNPELNSRILLDGYLGSKIHMERGIRQGDPVSGYLFNLIIEPLANQLKKSAMMKGIPMSRSTEVRVSIYADDLIVFSSAEVSSVNGILSELDEFTKYSGLRTNIEKTKCLPIGNSINTLELANLGVKIVSELKILGIVFNQLNQTVTENNLTTILPNIVKDIAQWRRRNLTLIGKITVVKSLLFSKLVHILTALPNPCEDVIKKLNSILFRFIWNNGADKVKRSILVQDYEHGGLKMLDMHSFLASLKCSWLKRLYWAKHDTIWASIAKEMLPPVEDVVCFGHSKLKELSSQLTNEFWRDVLNAWARFGTAYKPSPSEIITDKIWFSDNTKYKKTIVKKWNNNGLRFISDLLRSEDGRFHNREHLSTSFNINLNFLTYASLIRSIPAGIAISGISTEIACPVMPYKIALLSSRMCTAQIVYTSLVKALKENKKDSISRSTLENKWVRDVGSKHTDSLNDIRKSTKNTYLQNLHYRILKRIIGTNTFLHRIGRAENSLCTFCKNSDETLVHLLWDCNNVQIFIENMEDYLRRELNVTLHINKQKWFFPCLENESQMNIILITVAKYTILRSKYNNSLPNTRLFMAFLRLEVTKERGAAVRKNTVDDLKNKWGNILNILQEHNSFELPII